MKYEYHFVSQGMTTPEDFNELGAEGWRLVCIVGSKCVFIREIEEFDQVLADEQKRWWKLGS